MKCSFCNKKSIYFRRNEGHHYCDIHLSRSIERRVRKTIRENDLIDKKDNIVIALSGGKDSSTTLILLTKIFKNNPKIQIDALTIDIGFPHIEEDIEVGKELTKKLKVKHHIFSLKEEFGIGIEDIFKRNPEKSPCAICGVLRRYLINKKTRELGYKKVATGHNLDDESQSILMNFLKGDMMRLARSGAMPMITKNSKFVSRIKPLIKIPEEEVEIFVKINGIKYSPQECPYRKYNTFRGETIKYLNNMERNSPGIKYSLLESALRLKSQIEKQFEKSEIKLCKKCKEPTSKKICKTCEVLGGVLS
ncbi:MAG: TIGR00269 family protein [Candidatus Aenigmarchaeota archaeon]|nr:TIGR00269 family protein [Candidatus Aenigmarchaeota archaeon]